MELRDKKGENTLPWVKFTTQIRACSRVEIHFLEGKWLMNFSEHCGYLQMPDGESCAQSFVKRAAKKTRGLIGDRGQTTSP